MIKSEITLQYFAEREEQAVLDYIKSDLFEEKNKIYNEILIKPFRIMIESILRKYPIHIGNYDMNVVESNALTHLIENIVKYRPYIIEQNVGNNKWVRMGNDYRFFNIIDAQDSLKIINNDDYRIFYASAFSYCQTIIRNHYKDHSKKSYIEKKINLNFDEYLDEINDINDFTYEIEFENQFKLEKLIVDIANKIEERIENDLLIKKNESLVGYAIVNVLKNWEVLFMEDTSEGKYDKKVTNKFAKNKILFYLKEQTGLTTKEIRVGIKPFKDIYLLKKLECLDD
jgi:hypothetical protein